jgi:hypothetical protein
MGDHQRTMDPRDASLPLAPKQPVGDRFADRHVRTHRKGHDRRTPVDSSKIGNEQFLLSSLGCQCRIIQLVSLEASPAKLHEHETDKCAKSERQRRRQEQLERRQLHGNQPSSHHGPHDPSKAPNTHGPTGPAGADSRRIDQAARGVPRTQNPPKKTKALTPSGGRPGMPMAVTNTQPARKNKGTGTSPRRSIKRLTATPPSTPPT